MKFSRNASWHRSPRRSIGIDRVCAIPHVKIGVLNDRSGIYADLAGEGSVIAARMAVEDFEAADKGHQRRDRLGRPPEQARRRLDASRASGMTRTAWTSIVDVPTSSAALAVNDITREKNKIFINSGAAAVRSDRQPNARPTPSTGPTTPGRSPTAPAARWSQTGGKNWFFITADYAFGHALERDTIAVVKAAGGEVVGTVRHPFPGTDFSSFLLQAQSSGAEVIGLANAGGDTINSIKQACRIRHHPGRPGAGRAAGLHHRRPCARARDRAGAGADRKLLLGSQRRHPRLVEAVRRKHERRKCRPWCRPASMPACCTT